jgi:hypothetical protein
MSRDIKKHFSRDILGPIGVQKSGTEEVYAMSPPRFSPVSSLISTPLTPPVSKATTGAAEETTATAAAKAPQHTANPTAPSADAKHTHTHHPAIISHQPTHTHSYTPIPLQQAHTRLETNTNNPTHNLPKPPKHTHTHTIHIPPLTTFSPYFTGRHTSLRRSQGRYFTFSSSPHPHPPPHPHLPNQQTNTYKHTHTTPQTTSPNTHTHTQSTSPPFLFFETTLISLPPQELPPQEPTCHISHFHHHNTRLTHKSSYLHYIIIHSLHHHTITTSSYYHYIIIILINIINCNIIITPTTTPLSTIDHQQSYTFSREKCPTNDSFALQDITFSTVYTLYKVRFNYSYSGI